MRKPRACRQYHPFALDGTNAAGCTTKTSVCALAHLYKHHSPVASTQNEVYLPTTTARRPIIALYQLPATRQRILKRPVFCQLARIPLRSLWQRLFSKETH